MNLGLIVFLFVAVFRVTNALIAKNELNAQQAAAGATPVKTKDAMKDINEYDAEYGRLRSPSGDGQRKKHEKEEASSSIEPDEATTIAICGGGLAGLAVALGLERRGISCRVYERAPRLRSLSQGMLAIQPNGLQSLQTIHPDLPARVATAGCELRQVIARTIDSTGLSDKEDEIVRTREGVNEESIAKYGASAVLIQWHELQKTIASLLPKHKNIVMTGRSLSKFEEFEDHVVAYFEDGSKVKCQALLGCDGIFSKARQQILPNDRPIFFGQLNWNAIIPTSNLPSDVQPPISTVVHTLHNGSKNESRRWTAFLNDCGCSHTFWQLRVTEPDKALALSGSSGRGGLGLSGVKEALLPVISSSTIMTSALKNTPEEQIFERCILASLPADTWRSVGGKVALVGDAAHAMHPNVGQGGNSAFESAAAVVDAIVECNGDFRRGLEQYEKKRKPRATLVQKYSNILGCTQTTGQQILERGTRTEISDWIMKALPIEAIKVSKKDFEAIDGFDPFTSGVSKVEL